MRWKDDKKEDHEKWAHESDKSKIKSAWKKSV